MAICADEQRDVGDEAEVETSELKHASEGAGPLLQRDYWAVIEGSRRTPEELMQVVAADFARFGPEEVVCFSRPEGATAPLTEGDSLHVHIKGGGHCDVQILHSDLLSLTLSTVEGHPEAGRITFSAACNSDGNLEFHIRSRARAADLLHWVGWMLFGKHVQKRCWEGFIQRVADDAGGQIVGEISEETREVEETAADRGQIAAPTLCAGEVA